MNTYTKHLRPLGKLWTLTLASLCLLASCQSNKIGEDFESCHVQGINISKEPHQVLRYHVNLGNMPPFAPYVNKVVTFKSPCAIQVYHHFEGLIWYSLEDYTPQSGTQKYPCIRLIPIYSGKIACVVGTWVYIKNELFANNVKALVEVCTDQLNDGKPFYIWYDWGYEPTRKEGVDIHLKRAPWEPTEVKNNRFVDDIVKAAKLPSSSQLPNRRFIKIPTPPTP